MSANDCDSYQLYRLKELEPEVLERDLRIVIGRYQRCRARHLAHTVISYLEALRDHAAHLDGELGRCRYGRLIPRWRRLAEASVRLEA